MPFKEKFFLRANYIPKPSRRRSGLMISKIRFLVAHDTGNPGSTAAENVKYYINTCNTVPKSATASAHIFVDDKEIVECVPALTASPEKAWHVLYTSPKDNELYNANANDAAIGVEYCYGGHIDSNKAYEKYVWVLAKLCFEFHLDPSKDIVGHFFLDPKRKTDPVTGLANSRRTYEALLRDVVKEYDDCTGVAELVLPDLLQEEGIATTSVKLNIRSKPDRKSDIVQVIPPHTQVKYTAILKNGESINNNTTWYVDANGNFLWSGGLSIDNTPSPVVLVSSVAPIESVTSIVPAGTVVPVAPMVAGTILKPDKKCIDFIKNKEGLRLQAYQDSAGIWTIGFGTIKYDNNSSVKKGDVITMEQAEQLLIREILEKAAKVNAAIKPILLTQNQYDALVSFAYNAGTGALISSTLLKRVKANPDDDKIRDAFMMWDKAHVDGELIVVQGLKNRRTEEADMYFS